MGGYLAEDWQDGMAEWGTLAELFPDEPGVALTSAAPGPGPVRARSAARWIVPTVICVLLVIVGVFITVSYFSRKMAEASAPVITPPPNLDNSPASPGTANGTKSADLLPLPADPSEAATRDESAAVLKDVQQLSASCRDAEKDMLLLGFDPARLTSLEEIEKRRQSIAIVLPRVQAVVDYLAKIDQKVRADLQAKNVPAGDIDAFLTDMHHNDKQDALLGYWQQENAIALTMMDNLQLLRQNYGKWHLDGETVVFNDPAMLTVYRANVDKLKADIANQQAAQARLKGSSPADTPPSNP